MTADATDGYGLSSACFSANAVSGIGILGPRFLNPLVRGQPFPELGQDRFRVDGFGQVIIHTGIHANLAIAFHCVGRHGDDGDQAAVPPFLIGPVIFNGTDFFCGA